MAFFGLFLMSVGIFAVIAALAIAVYITECVTAGFVFKKYGEKFWKAFIPLYKEYTEYKKVYTPKAFLIIVVLMVFGNTVMPRLYANAEMLKNISTYLSAVFSLVPSAVNLMFSVKKSKAFGGGIPLGLVLFVCPAVGNIIIAADNKRVYGGNTDS